MAQSTVLKFTKDSNMHGYGYDFGRSRVVSFKKVDTGIYIGTGHELVKMNGYTFTQYSIRLAAVAQRNLEALLRDRPSAASNPVTIDGAVPYAYIIFSVKEKCSQYFDQGTTLARALAIFAKRNIVLDPAELSILNPVTGNITKLKVTVVTTYEL